jgi:hypothetical protein
MLGYKADDNAIPSFILTSESDKNRILLRSVTADFASQTTNSSDVKNQWAAVLF